MRYFGLALIPCLCAGCAPAPEQAAPPPADVEFINLEKFHAPMLECARAYEKYTRVETRPQLGPPPGSGACAPAPSPNPLHHRGFPEISASGDLSTHGRKLFWLFAKDVSMDRKRYTDLPVPVGQAIVKESWVPTRVQEKDFYGPYETVEMEGERFRAGEKAALFVMFKMDPRTPDTDQGWVYGTLTADGKTVTSAGKVASCMRCHQQAPHERLFGLPEPK